MIKINLLSEGKRPAAVRKARGAAAPAGDMGQWLLIAGALFGVLAAAGYWYLLKGRLDDKVAEVAQAQKEYDELQEVIKEVDAFKKKKADLERKIKIITDLKLNQRGPVHVMDYISRALPELLWLDRMSMGPTSIQLEGRAFNTNAVADFMTNLEKYPEFKEPTLKDTKEQAGGIYTFVLNFDYSFAKPVKPGAPGAPGVPGAAGASVPGALGAAPSPTSLSPGSPGAPGAAGAPGGTTTKPAGAAAPPIPR